jgi:hypothetical protein
VLVTNNAAGMLNKLATVPVPLFVKRMKEAFVQVPPEAKSESAWIAAIVPPGLVEEPPKVARSALPAPEIVPEPLMLKLTCAPLTVPPVAAPSPEPVEVNSKRPYDKRVSPVVAEVVAYDSEILPAVVSTTGLEAVPEMKPFCDMTGPENVVFAMIFSLHASGAYLSACRQPGLSDTPENPGMV